MQRKNVIIGLACIIVAVAIIVPIALYVTKDPVPCYPVYNDQVSCYADNLKTWYRWYGPKTDYAISTGLNTSDAKEIKVHDCTPRMFYMFNRHSARFPDLGDLIKMNATLQSIKEQFLAAVDGGKGKVKLCDEDVEELRKWEPLYHLDDAAQAMQQGNEDVHLIAQRFKKRLPTLLPDEYSPETYKFGMSNRERTNQSLQAFMEKILNETEFAKLVYPERDVTTVSFHKGCERKLWPHHRLTKPSRELFDEPESYRRGPVAQRLVENVKRRLGIENSNFTYSDIRQIAVECAVSFTAYRGSPWCGVLSKDDLLVTEYDDDIYDYHKDSYGRPLNRKMGCPVVNEIVDLFGDLVKNPNGQHFKSVLYFAHSRDYKKLLGSFDFFRDEKPLTAGDYCTDKVRNRKWRSSNMSPYSANIGFVLYECKGTFKVLTLLNEKPVKLPHCSYQDRDFLCDYREFASKYRFKNCDIEKICVPSALKEEWPDSHWEDQ